MKTTTIDNKGQGDCMYYAYAISLMYHLRAQEETYYLPIIERLQLNNKNQTRILNIIKTHQKSTVRFDKQTQGSIQDILAPALRAFLSQVVKEEFKTNPFLPSYMQPRPYSLSKKLKD